MYLNSILILQNSQKYEFTYSLVIFTLNKSNDPSYETKAEQLISAVREFVFIWQCVKNIHPKLPASKTEEHESPSAKEDTTVVEVPTVAAQAPPETQGIRPTHTFSFPTFLSSAIPKFAFSCSNNQYYIINIININIIINSINIKF